MLASYNTPNGQSALIPAAGIDDFTDIANFVKLHTSSDPVVQEAASVIVLNGTTTNGLASKVQRRLKQNNIFTSKIGDAGNIAQAATAIINLSGTSKPATSAKLVQLFGNHLTTQNPYGTLYQADFIIVLGTDQATTTPSANSNSQ